MEPSRTVEKCQKCPEKQLNLDIASSQVKGDMKPNKIIFWKNFRFPKLIKRNFGLTIFTVWLGEQIVEQKEQTSPWLIQPFKLAENFQVSTKLVLQSIVIVFRQFNWCFIIRFLQKITLRRTRGLDVYKSRIRRPYTRLYTKELACTQQTNFIHKTNEWKWFFLPGWLSHGVKESTQL